MKILYLFILVYWIGFTIAQNTKKNISEYKLTEKEWFAEIPVTYNERVGFAPVKIDKVAPARIKLASKV